jgi:hypothetical protein
LSGTRAIFDQSGNALAGNGTTAGTNYVDVFTINRSADQPPVATAQSDSVAEGGSVQIVLAAITAAGYPATYSIATPPADGTLSAITNGNTVTYIPAAGFYGTDSFSFQATDPDGGESQATVSLTVTPVDQPPVAIPASVSVIHDKAQVIVLGATDAETPASRLTYTISAQPAHGTLTAVPGTPNAFTYTPAAGYLDADSFAFTVTDTGNPAGNLANRKTSAPATVLVAESDPAPVGVPASYATRAGVPLTVPAATGVVAHDTDAAGDPLTATLATGPSHGTLTLSPNGSFVYTPAAGYTGTDSFSYVPHGTYTAGAATTVTITVAAAAAPPPPPPPHASIASAVVEAAQFTPLVSMAAPKTVQPAPAGAALASTPAAVPTVAAQAAVAPVTTTTPTRVTTTAAAPATPGLRAALPAVSNLWLDATALMAVTDPIILPNFTVPGDEASLLMLPAVPEMSHLPQAFASAARRVTETTPSIVSFVDPASGRALDEPSGTRSAGPSWLLVDTDPDVVHGAVLGPGRIQWDNGTL